MKIKRQLACLIQIVFVSLLFVNCKARQSDSGLQSDLNNKEYIEIKNSLNEVLSQQQLLLIRPLSEKALFDLPASLQGFAPPFGQMPGFVMGVDPNGGQSTYNAKAIEAFKVKMQALFFQQERQGRKLFSAVAIRLGRFGLFSKKAAVMMLNRQAAKEMESGYETVAAKGLKQYFSEDKKQLEQRALLIRDDKDQYFKTFDLPIKKDEPTIHDPVPVTLVVKSGRFKIGPFFIPQDEDVIVEAMNVLMK